MLDGNEQLKWLLITLAVIPFLIFLYLTAKQILNRCNEISDLRFAKNELVDDFDDKVCYWVMTAVSFCDLLEEKEGANEQTSVDEIIPFLFQKTNFYVNKSIEKFHEFQPAAKVIFKNGSGRSKQINSYRLETVVQILYQVRKRSYNVINAQQKGGGWKAATVSAPLAGFSHGVAGIVYALNKLYKLYPDKHIKQCIVNGLQYEDELFCEADGNWKDIRKGSTNGKNLCAWCHGAGGILLSRISLLGNIDNETDEIVKEDIRNAVKTMQSHKYLQNPCVCHGIAGNAEILLTYGQQFQDQIASSTAKHFYSRLVGSVNSGTFECSRPYLYGFNIPGFMTGLAGIGYSLLRLLDPTLPSVLQINI